MPPQESLRVPVPSPNVCPNQIYHAGHLPQQHHLIPALPIIIYVYYTTPFVHPSTLIHPYDNPTPTPISHTTIFPQGRLFWLSLDIHTAYFHKQSIHSAITRDVRIGHQSDFTVTCSVQLLPCLFAIRGGKWIRWSFCFHLLTFIIIHMREQRFV